MTFHRQSSSVIFLAIAAAASWASGCSGEVPAIADVELEGRDFEAIERPLSTAEAEAQAAIAPGDVRARGGSETFYLAIRKEALAERWFLSAFMKQHFPDQVLALGASSLGTRVVSFRIQNGVLYVFDVADGKAWSDVLDPDLIIDAFPILEERDLPTRNGRQRYVILDPSKGKSRFSFVSDVFGAAVRTRLEVELAFSEGFRAIADGATWETIFTGYTEQPIDPSLPGEANPFKVSGTLGMSLRRYREGEQYQPFEMEIGGSPEQEFFFRDEIHQTEGGGQTQVAARWNIHPGMQPIEWVIAPEVAELDASPGFEDIDLVGTFKRGIEDWNQAFGFPVFTARLGTEGETFSQDDKNYVILDDNPNAGFAFANWRTNPNTGEIRGASVYFSTVFIDPAMFAPPPEEGATARHLETPKVGQLQWDGVSSKPLCVVTPPKRLPYQRASAADDPELSPGQALERFVAHVLAHEIGHTLSLRHNFKGTLVPPTSSVMDYTLDGEALAIGSTPGAYDVAAVRYLYGLADEAPTQPFCPDDLVGLDPDCQQFDAGAEPLTDYHAADYTGLIDAFLAGAPIPPFVIEFVAPGLTAYIETGDDARALQAWAIATARVAAPLAEADRTPETTFTSNLVMGFLLPRLAAQHNPVVASRIIAQARLIGRNDDKVRPRELRQAMIDLLKAMQTLEAFQAIRQLRTDIAASINSGTLGREEVLIARDLMARIDAAIDPYFE